MKPISAEGLVVLSKSTLNFSRMVHLCLGVGRYAISSRLAGPSPQCLLHTHIHTHTHSYNDFQAMIFNDSLVILLNLVTLFSY